MLNAIELKELVKTPAFLAEMETVFFQAMSTGYANNAKKETFADVGKLVDFTEGPWTVIDGYLKTPLGPRSGGLMAMSYEGVPVWMMQYMGQYSDDAIPCLKAALRAAYVEKKFFGGRGPERFVCDGLVYQNDVDRSYRGDFQGSNFFQGYEKIQRQGSGPNGAPGEALGWHSYQGMMML